MSLILKMQINEQPENQYVFSTGDGGEIELIPLSVVANGSYSAPDGKAYNLVTVNVPDTELESLNITENGTYNAPDGKAYNVVTVNVQPILEAVSRTYSANGTYTIAPSAGKDGLSGVTVVVDVPQDTPDLQSKTETYTENGNYTIQADSGYDGLDTVSVEVNVPATPTPSIQASKSQTITQNGTVTVSPDSGYDAMEKAEITVNVPTGGNVQNFKQVTYNQNGYYQVTPDTGYDGIATVGIGIEVPTGGGGGDVLTGSFTPVDGTNAVPITVPAGKTIKSAMVGLANYNDQASFTIGRSFVYSFFEVTDDGGYNLGLYKSSTTTAPQTTGAHKSSTPAISLLNPLGLDSTKTQLMYFAKSGEDGYGFVSGFVYDYLVVLE